MHDRTYYIFINLCFRGVIMPSRSELWKKIKELELDKTQGLKYSMSKAAMGDALEAHMNRYLRNEEVKESRHIRSRGPFKNPKKAKKTKKTKKSAKEEPVKEKPREPEEIPETPEVEEITMGEPEPAIDNDFDDTRGGSEVELPEELEVNLEVTVPESDVVDPKLERANKIFSTVAETHPPTNKVTWRPWWIECRRQLKADADREDIQDAMRDWIKTMYDYAV